MKLQPRNSPFHCGLYKDHFGIRMMADLSWGFFILSGLQNKRKHGCLFCKGTLLSGL